jgi:hypothetical protein
MPIFRIPLLPQVVREYIEEKLCFIKATEDGTLEQDEPYVLSSLRLVCLKYMPDVKELRT